jgi:hypothetical protein
MTESSPLSAQDRFCSRFSTAPCSEFPCKHVPWHGHDWLDDLEELYQDPNQNILLWASFRRPMFWCLRLEHEKWTAIVPKFGRCRRIEAQRKRIDKRIKAYFQSPIGEVAEKWKPFPEEFLKKLRLNWRYRTRNAQVMIENKHFRVMGIPPFIPGKVRHVDLMERPWSDEEIEWKLKQIEEEDERILAGPPNADVPEIWKKLYPNTERAWQTSTGLVMSKSASYV